MKQPPQTPRQRAKAAYRTLLREAGGKKVGFAAIANAIGKTRQAVQKWPGVVPETSLLAVCAAFHKEPRDIRPDLSDFQLRQLIAAAKTK